MIRKLAILTLPLVLGACATEPAYPITPPQDAGAPPSASVSPAAPPPPSPEAPTYYRPRPIPGAPPPPDEAGANARRRRSPGPPPALRSPPPPMVYTVKVGDTLMSISRRFSIDARALASLNDIALDSLLKPGQRLALPAPVRDGQATTAVSRPRSRQTALNPPATPIPAPISAPIAQASRNEPEPPSAIAAAGKGRFVWPVKGEILSGFGPKGPGQRNDGLNISAEAGDPVRAAAAGQVVYAGATIPGFGNLVVIKHPDGWTSLYGNLGKIAVKIRAEVAQGQALGVAGLSGAVDRPQVHFEVRYAATPQEKAQPVDPQSLLP